MRIYRVALDMKSWESEKAEVNQGLGCCFCVGGVCVFFLEVYLGFGRIDEVRNAVYELCRGGGG